MFDKGVSLLSLSLSVNGLVAPTWYIYIYIWYNAQPEWTLFSIIYCVFTLLIMILANLASQSFIFSSVIKWIWLSSQTQYAALSILPSMQCPLLDRRSGSMNAWSTCLDCLAGKSWTFTWSHALFFTFLKNQLIIFLKVPLGFQGTSQALSFYFHFGTSIELV